MRLPNGYGSVYKLSGHRRRPYVVKKTIDGRQRALGYFESYQAAFEFLVEINHCTPSRQVTFAPIHRFVWLVQDRLGCAFPHVGGYAWADVIVVVVSTSSPAF